MEITLDPDQMDLVEASLAGCTLFSKEDIGLSRFSMALAYGGLF